MKKLFQNFFLCGIIGWCTEIIFTSMHSLLHRDYRLLGVTSLWMFPIYGLGTLLFIPYNLIKKCSFFVRGIVYTFCIFFVEFLSGQFLTKIHSCPWNYEHSRFHIRKVIRLDYAPFWFLYGLLLEKILHSKHNEPL